VAPVLTGVPTEATIPELQPYTFDAAATDADLPAQTLSFSLVGAPEGAAIDAATGVFNWTPSEAQGPGDYSFTVRGTDGVANTDQPVILHVSEVIDASLDADGNGTADALSDGILILRYLFDPAGAWNVADALGSGATRTSRAQIKGYLDGVQTTVLDADGNGTADALSDGILILRYLFDPTGAWNVADALGSGATRTTRAAIKAYLDQFNPGLASASLLTAAETPAGDSSLRVAIVAGAAGTLRGQDRPNTLVNGEANGEHKTTPVLDLGALDRVLERWNEPRTLDVAEPWTRSLAWIGIDTSPDGDGEGQFWGDGGLEWYLTPSDPPVNGKQLLSAGRGPGSRDTC
jgi:hypothetical protein